jgi:hypothetical protein
VKLPFYYSRRIWVFGDTGTASCLASGGLGKNSMTISLAGNAAGENLLPLILFNSRNWWDSWMVPTGEEYLGITCTVIENGWLQATTIQQNFARNIGPEGQAALIFEGCRCSLGLV